VSGVLSSWTPSRSRTWPHDTAVSDTAAAALNPRQDHATVTFEIWTHEVGDEPYRLEPGRLS